WDNEYYYLVAYDGADRKIKHYRIDRMERIKVLEKEKREGAKEYKDADVRSYSKRMFSMFSGEEQQVTLRFAERLANVVIDRFGKDVILAPDGEGFFRVSVTVFCSPQFFAWLFGLGSGVQILAPETVKRDYVQTLRDVLGQYGTE
ncbi:MAG: WYL domain-containing protein, partial [Firmicutes bacterium]|nr:WYL domain-containing protein [Bacillota bacterium]